MVMSLVCRDGKPVVIKREDKEPVVLMPLRELRSLEETLYLMRSPKNAARLYESIAELESSGGLVKEI